MADLKTDYKDDVLDASKNTARVYDLVDSNGTVVLAGVHLEDKTVYTNEGDDYGAADINEQNGKINELSADLTDISDDVTDITLNYVGMPDYNNEIATNPTMPYTATEKCWLIAWCGGTVDSKFYINDVEMVRAFGISNAYASTCNIQVPLNVGDVIRFTPNNTNKIVHIFGMK